MGDETWVERLTIISDLDSLRFDPVVYVRASPSG
jgi:hypothetical protein